MAALACANLLAYYLNDPALQISSLKASELSGFMLDETDAGRMMEDALVIAISQSGTTTDTNRDRRYGPREGRPHIGDRQSTRFRPDL